MRRYASTSFIAINKLAKIINIDNIGFICHTAYKIKSLRINDYN